MPAWSFRGRFRAALSNGLAEAAREPSEFLGIRPKRQTIRAARADGRDIKPGAEVNVWLDMRTPGRVFLGTTPPVRRVRVSIDDQVWIEGAKLSPGGVTKLARADGFQTAAEMLAFIERDHGFPFVGFRFRW